MFFTSSEKKARHQFIDASIDVVNEVLDNEHSARYLGAGVVSLYQGYVDRLYVPNNRHGKIITKSADSEAIPVVAVGIGESLRLSSEMALPTDTQKARVTKMLQEMLPGGEYWSDATTDEILADSERHPIVLRADKYMNALVRHSYNHFNVQGMGQDESYQGQIMGRPTLVLRSPNGSRVDPSAFIHEIDHVADGQWYPLSWHKTPDDVRKNHLRKELEAYHVQALAIQAMVAMGYEHQPSEGAYYKVENGRINAPIVGAVEKVRRTVNKDRDDKYYPDEEIDLTLQRANIDIAAL